MKISFHKALRLIVVVCILCISLGTAIAWLHGSGEIPFNSGKSEGQSNSLSFGGDYPFINLLKTSADWGTSNHPLPSTMDANGYPNSATASNFLGIFNAPGQSERPGHQVVTWLGSGKVGAFYQSYGSTQTVAACTGTGSSNAFCDNTACGSLTGSITGRTLTVTVAPGCSLAVGQPIAGFISQWDVPTFITGNSTTSSSLCSPACTGAGGTGTYAVNWSQTVGSGSIAVGGRLELAAGTETQQWVTWELQVAISTLGNTPQHIAFMHTGDESTYWGGEIFGTLYKARLKQGGFGVWRDLDWSAANLSTCTTWATRKPVTYWSYAAADVRSAMYAGTLTYALNGSSNDYSVTFGSGGPVDKQTILATVPAGGSSTTTTVTFNLNGTGAVPVTLNGGEAFLGTTYTPVQNARIVFVYDAALNVWLAFGGGNTNSIGNGLGLQCGAPPEVFLQLNKEIGMHPWFVSPYLALDPMTDWISSLATYVKANQSSWMIPRFELPDETWNCVQAPASYASAKSFAHWAVTANVHCGSHGDVAEWLGMIGSTVGQDIFAVYGNKSKYKVITGVQTALSASPTLFNGSLASAQFVANGPLQSGYVQTAAYNWVTSICIAPYWSPTQEGTQAEVASAYNYSLAPSEVIMAPYIGTAANPYLTTLQAWSTWASAAPYHITQMEAYEGGFNLGDNPLLSSSQTVGVSTATNAVSAVLTANGNGAVVGMTVTPLAASGGTWSTVIGNNYTVTGVTTNTITIGLDSTALGTLSSMTLQYTGSKIYINAMRVASYSSTTMASRNIDIYNNLILAGGEFPSMYVLSSGSGPISSTPVNCSWCMWNPDIYGATISSSDPGTPQWQAISTFN